MPPRHPRATERYIAPVLTAALMAVGLLAPSAAAGASPQDPAVSPLHTFQIPKPVSAAVDNRQPAHASIPVRPPASKSSLRTMFGVGYVQGADWGSEVLAGGSVAGAQVQFNTLLTRGREGLLFDQGSLSVADADGGWRAEAGDIFSHLRGASIGGRVSWGAGKRRPAIAIFGPGRVANHDRTVVSYRDQLLVRGRTLLDAEVASDKSYLLRSRIATSRLEVEGFFRQERGQVSRRDASIAGAVTHDHLGGGIAGVRVKLGPYTADTNVTGTFTFAAVPRGEYELSIDSQLLPADVAWDGRSQRLVLRSSGDVRVNLGVTPLNAIHGRVYEDRNGNNRLDDEEAVAGATVRAGANLTATDADGAYAFYNLAPGTYVVQLQSVPAGFAMDLATRAVTLSDSAPAIGQDFRVQKKDKPIVWEGSQK